MEKIKQLNEWLKKFEKWQLVTVSFVIGFGIWFLFISDHGVMSKGISESEVIASAEEVLSDDFFDRGADFIGFEKRNLDIEKINDKTYVITGNVKFNEDGFDYTSPFEIKIRFTDDDYEQFRYEWEVF